MIIIKEMLRKTVVKIVYLMANEQLWTNIQEKLCIIRRKE